MTIDFDDLKFCLLVCMENICCMEHVALSVLNSSWDAYKLISDDNKCVGGLLEVVVACWIIT